MPKTAKIYEKYKDQIEVIGINLRENTSTIEKFVNKNNISFPIALDPSGQVANLYGIRYTNTHFLINKEGEIVKSIPGDLSENDFLSLL